MTATREGRGAAAAGEVHARRVPGEIVLSPDTVDSFLERQGLTPPHEEFGGIPVEVEVRTADADQNPPHGAVWLTAVDADVSIRADPVEILNVLQEAGILDRLRSEGRLPFL